MKAQKTGHELVQALESGLSSPGLAALDEAVRLATVSGRESYLVGGAVRDLALGVDHVDLDIVVEGDVGELAQSLASNLGGRVVRHPRFETATVSGKGFHLDLAMARSEVYQRPGALPEVASAALQEDLGRRDFTINAVALRLTEPRGEIIDPFAGLEDLRSESLRALHEASFRDDATRIIRGIRYATRLRFSLEPSTLRWLRKDARYLQEISGPRLRRELAALFGEPNAPEGVRAARDYGVLSAIDQHFNLREEVADRWAKEAASELAPKDELGFCLTIGDADSEAIPAVSKALHLAGRIETALTSLSLLSRSSTRFDAKSTDKLSIIETLDRFRPSSVWAYGLLEGGDTQVLCGEYLHKWRHLRPELTGSDLAELGWAPGPQIGKILRELRRAVLDGRVKSRADEIAITQTLGPPTTGSGGSDVSGRKAKI